MSTTGHVKIPAGTSRYTFEVGFHTFTVAPDMFAVLDVDQAMFAAALPEGVPMPPVQRAALARVLVAQFLSAPDREAFAALGAEAQGVLVLGLLRAYNEIRDGQDAVARRLGLVPAKDEPGPDPTPPSSPSPAPAASRLGSA